MERRHPLRQLGLDLVAPVRVSARSLPRLARYVLSGRGQDSAPDVLYRHDVDRIEITCDRQRIKVVLNGDRVTEADLSEFTEPNKRPDGTAHKFDIAYKDHPQRGYIGLQDHGSPCWFKNIKLKPLK